MFAGFATQSALKCSTSKRNALSFLTAVWVRPFGHACPCTWARAGRGDSSGCAFKDRKTFALGLSKGSPALTLWQDQGRPSVVSCLICRYLLARAQGPRREIWAQDHPQGRADRPRSRADRRGRPPVKEACALVGVHRSTV